MSIVGSFKAKLTVGGILLSVLPLLVVIGMTIRTQRITTDVAASECARLGYDTLDHIAVGVANSCAAEAAASPATAAVDPQAVASQALRQSVMAIKVGKSGYVYVLDSKGNYVISAGGKRDGENIWQAKDADGVLFIQELIAKARRAPAGTTVEQRYPWLNKGDTKARLKVARATYFAEWDWVIGAGAYFDDFLSAEHQIRAASESNVRSMILTCVISFIVVAGLAWMGSRKLTAPLLGAVQMANAVAVGDLSGRMGLTRNDEIGDLARALDRMTVGLAEKADLATSVAQGDLTMEVRPHGPADVFGWALKTMTERLSTTLEGIQQAAAQVSCGANEISDSSLTLSKGATDQAAALQEISASLLELSADVTQNAENADQANQLSLAAQEAADGGTSLMQDMTTAMSDISHSSREISNIIKVINDIASQTNLLALNAAVEAARAGHHGKGFAVVAEEVRNLAARSAKAARESNQLISGSLQKVERGTTIVGTTSGSLAAIVDAVSRTSTLVGEIAAASSRQSRGIAEVSEGLRQIDGVTQQTSANSEEGAAASQELAGQAASLQKLAAQFHLRQDTGREPATASGNFGRPKIAELVGSHL